MESVDPPLNTWAFLPHSHDLYSVILVGSVLLFVFIWMISVQKKFFRWKIRGLVFHFFQCGFRGSVSWLTCWIGFFLWCFVDRSRFVYLSHLRKANKNYFGTFISEWYQVLQLRVYFTFFGSFQSTFLDQGCISRRDVWLRLVATYLFT